ncbi:MAG TPA: Crp/Fnr family transcriptional regulator [Firmicutes bacterium]|nr:Crp/Fnr family transcriptional regulator [Bacillota bacterium]
MFVKWKEQLTHCPLFTGIEPDELRIMLACLQPVVRRYRKNEYVTRAGEKFLGVGVVLVGQAIVTKENVAGNRVIISSIHAGDLFAEMAAFSGLKVWPATVIAQQETEVFFLPPEKIVGNCARQCPSHRRLITNMLRIVSEKAMSLNRKVEQLSIKSLRGKIATFLLEQAKQAGATTFMLPFNRNEMADFLNVARPSLSREMGKMKAEGLIDFHGASVKISDVQALKRMVE